VGHQLTKVHEIRPSQHMQMAALMHRKSQQASTPENRQRLAELAPALVGGAGVMFCGCGCGWFGFASVLLPVCISKSEALLPFCLTFPEAMPPVFIIG
jgi:hypothetical protein